MASRPVIVAAAAAALPEPSQLWLGLFHLSLSSSTPSRAVPTKSKYFGPPLPRDGSMGGKKQAVFNVHATSVVVTASRTPPHTTCRTPLSPHSIPDKQRLHLRHCYYYDATRGGQPSCSSAVAGGGTKPCLAESSAWTVWPAVGKGLPCALVLVLALALLFSGSPGACCLYSTLVFMFRLRSQGWRRAALSHYSSCPPHRAL